MKIGRFAILVLLGTAGFVRAADVNVAASLDRQQVALNEQAILSVTISGTGSNLPEPQIPALPDFQIYNAGRAQNFSWINGQASASVTYQYVLTPLKEGSFKIPPIRIQGSGGSAQTPELSLDVVKGNPAAVASATPAAPEDRRAGSSHSAAALFITATVDKNTAYVGEPVIYSFRLYNRVPLLSNPNYQKPQTSGFWAEDLPPQRNYTTTYKGVPYSVTEVREALFPTTAGSARVDSAQLTVHLENLGGDPTSPDFFAQFFGRGEEKTLRTDPISIRVKSLPKPKPEGFKGAVGTYSIAADVDKQTVPAGQPMTLTVTVSGKGNIKSIPDMTLPEIQSFRTFDPTTATNIEKKDYVVSGSKVFKTVLIPTVSGNYQIPSLPFVFFDPDRHQYRTVSTRAFEVHVTPGAAGPSNPTTANLPSTPSPTPSVRLLGEDIRYIKTPARLPSEGKPLYRQVWFIIFNLCSFLGLVVVGVLQAYRRVFQSDQKLVRFRAASAHALAIKKEAETALERNEIKSAASQIGQALRDFLAAKLSMDDHSLSLKEAMVGLRSKGVSSHQVEKVRNLWESLDLYQFAPSQAKREEIRSALSTFGHVIEELDRELVWKA